MGQRWDRAKLLNLVDLAGFVPCPIAFTTQSLTWESFSLQELSKAMGLWDRYRAKTIYIGIW